MFLRVEYDMTKNPGVPGKVPLVGLGVHNADEYIVHSIHYTVSSTDR